MSAPFGGWSRGPARPPPPGRKTQNPGRVDAGPTRPRPLLQGRRAGAAPFAPSHRPGQLLGGATPAVADPAGSYVSACGELPCTAFRRSAIFPSMSPARPAAPCPARGRVFRRSAATRACAELGERLRRRRDGVQRRVGGCEVPFLWTSKRGQKLLFLHRVGRHKPRLNTSSDVRGGAVLRTIFWKPHATAGYGKSRAKGNSPTVL